MSDAPYTGDVYWCPEFPGLHNHADKGRYAVVISPPDKLPDPLDSDGKYLVVPTSASSLSPYKVKLPNKVENPQTTSGLPEVCCAVCDEYKFVTGCLLAQWAGTLRTPTVALLQAKVRSISLARVAEKEASSPPIVRSESAPSKTA